MSNFMKIKETRDKMRADLAYMTSGFAADRMREETFRRDYCDGCKTENCDAENCVARNNFKWFVFETWTEEKPSQIEMWVEKEGYREVMEEFSGKIKEAVSKRIEETGKRSLTDIEVLLNELVKFLLPDGKCRVVMDYDQDAEKVTFSKLPAHGIQSGT